MYKERFEKEYNGMYSFSKSMKKHSKKFYILKQKNDYRCIDSRSNSVWGWSENLKELEEN